MPPSLLVAMLALAPPPARADSMEPAAAPELALEWRAPERCPDGERVRELIRELVPSGPSPVELRAIASVEPAPGGFSATLQLLAGPRRTTRALFAEDCTLLARATAVVVAVSLDPIATVEELRADPEDLGPEPVETIPTVPLPPSNGTPTPSGRITPPTEDPDASRTPATSSADRTHASSRQGHADTTARPPAGLEWGARLGAGIGGLLLPGPGLGASLSPFVGSARLHVRANLQYWAPQRVALDTQRDASGELQLVTAGLRVCPQLRRDRLRIPLCAGFDAGAMLGHGEGRDLAASHRARQPWVGAVLQPGLAIDVTPRISLWLALEGVLSLYRPSFTIAGASRDFTAGAGDVRGLVGLELHARRHNS